MQRSSLVRTESMVGVHDPRDNCDNQSGSSRQGEHRFGLLRKIERGAKTKYYHIKPRAKLSSIKMESECLVQ